MYLNDEVVAVDIVREDHPLHRAEDKEGKYVAVGSFVEKTNLVEEPVYFLVHDHGVEALGPNLYVEVEVELHPFQPK